jgi:hypothetical protein
MLLRSAGGATLLAFLIVLAAGCSDNKTGQVSGTVLVDGQPIEKGAISFVPVDGKGQTAGGEIKDGKYLVPNASPGTMKVEIRYSKVTGTKKLYDDEKSPVRNTYGEGLPEKYHDKTELRFDVKPGKNEKNWDLSTK